jgi:hypothetical protein
VAATNGYKLFMRPHRNQNCNGFNILPAAASLLLFITVLAGSGTVCLAGQAKPPAAVISAAPPTTYLGELEVMINNAEDVYEHAKANRWKHIGNKLNAIKKAEQSRLMTTNDINVNLLPRLIEATSELELAVAAQHRLDSMIFANRIMIICAKMAAPHNPRIPTNIAAIGYSARKLEILAESQFNEIKMSEIVYKIHLSWQPLIPQVIEHGGSKEIKKFAEIMKRLEGAKSAEEYARQASSILEEVNVLEQIFQK